MRPQFDETGADFVGGDEPPDDDETLNPKDSQEGE
jgi:hypothetical protein